MENLANEVAKLAIQEVVGNGFRHLVWLVIGVLGLGFIGRRYRLMKREVEEIKQRPPIIVNVGKDQQYDPEAVARELHKIYARQEAERIVRTFRPGGSEYEAVCRKDDEE